MTHQLKETIILILAMVLVVAVIVVNFFSTLEHYKLECEYKYMQSNYEITLQHEQEKQEDLQNTIIELQNENQELRDSSCIK